jgi:DNA-binding CsgD family transcriptional regulator
MPPRVVGRAAELDAVDELLDALADGPSQLLVEGEPGIGKTTLWQAATERARERDYRVLVSRPSPAETRLTYAGLGDLLAEVDDDVFSQLPAPQRRALRVALLREDPDGPAPEQRVVSTAFLGTLKLLSAERPVLIAVDDLQWLDTPSRRVLDFALRRVAPTRIGVLAAVRPSSDSAGELVSAETRRIRLPPLSLASLSEILREELGTTFARPTLVRIEATSSGNPFFAVELARALVESDEPVHGAARLPVPGDLTELIAGRLRRLPATVQRALLAAAALSAPSLELLDGAALRKAEKAGVVAIDGAGSVRFEHPLLAASVYATASVDDRRDVHRKLAERVTSPEERARHLALAADEPDEEVAAALAEGAKSARNRGAPDSAIELLELACDLTPTDRTGQLFARRLDLGRYLSESGDPERASSVLRDVAENAPSGAERARALLLLAFRSETSQAGDAAGLCVAALEAAEGEPELQVEVLAAASRMSDEDVGRKAAYAREAHELAAREAAVSPALEAYALLALAEAQFFEGRGLRMDLIDHAAELEEAAGGTRQGGRPLHRVHHYGDVRPSARLLGILRIYADDLDEARLEFELERDVALAHGDDVQLARTLIRLAVIETRAGSWDLAETHVEEAHANLEHTRQDWLRCWLLVAGSVLDTLRGRTDRARARGEGALDLAATVGSIWFAADSLTALGFLDLTLGDVAAARSVFTRSSEVERRIGMGEPRLLRSHPDHVETLVALGELDAAEEVLARLDPAASAWAAATGARCRALVSSARGDLDGAVAAVENALVAHDGLPIPFERARTLLVKGQVLRRRNERRLGAEALDASIELFETLGSPLWVARAQAERSRLGLRKGPTDELTPSEQTVAALAASGLTNREIAERIFVSPKTVEANLARAYRKLGIHSRAELGARMATGEPAET